MATKTTKTPAKPKPAPAGDDLGGLDVLLGGLNGRAKGPKCRAGFYLRTASPAVAEAIQSVIDRIRNGESIAAEASRVLKANGYDLAPWILNRHARKDCLCDA